MNKITIKEKIEQNGYFEIFYIFTLDIPQSQLGI